MKKITLLLTLVCVTVLVGCSLNKKTTTIDETNLDGTKTTVEWSIDDTTTDDTTIEENKDTQQDATKEEITTTPADVIGKYSFDDENCNKYVKLMECLIEKTPDSAKNQTADSFKKVMELWSGFEKNLLPSTCKNTIDMLTNQKDVFAKVGCEIK